MAAGISTYLRERTSSCKVVLVDPPGSSLLARVRCGVAFSASSEREGRRKRTQVDTIIEGIGQVGRVTANFSEAHFDAAVHCTDQECVDMARYVLRHEGLFIGSSSAGEFNFAPLFVVSTLSHVEPQRIWWDWCVMPNN